jgi:hypothetical protein
MKKLHVLSLKLSALSLGLVANVASALGWLGPLKNITNLAKGSTDTIMAVFMLIGILWFIGAVVNIKKLGDENVPPKTKNAIFAGIPAALLAIFLYSAIDMTKVSFLGGNAQSSSKVQKSDFGI